VAALVLSVNPALKSQEVKDLFKRACDKIDPQGGAYDDGGHSQKYGYGRLNARTAVDLAKPQPQSGVTVRRVFDAPIMDLQSASFSLEVGDSSRVKSLAVEVDLKHTFIGDLVITLHPPDGIQVAPVVLHNRRGGATKDLKKRYDVATTPPLAGVAGKKWNGTWTLQIEDKAARDFGTLVAFALELAFAQSDRVAPPPPKKSARKKKAKK
jgi:subtilisin-like proprotein convertase family protein